MKNGVMNQLLCAIDRDDARKVRKLIEKYSIDIDEMIDGERLIVLAARDESHAVVELLLNAGANVNGEDLEGSTACHLAAENGDIALLELLHARGADLNAKDIQGETPLYLAAQECEVECAKRLVELGASLESISVQFALASAHARQCMWCRHERS